MSQSTISDFIILQIRTLSGKINVKNLLIILSVLIGTVAAILAIVLKIIVHEIEDLLQYNFESKYQNYLYFLYPLAGILLTILYINIFRKGVLVKGLTSLVYALYKKSPNMAPHKIYSHMISSALTVGFGGSVGLEAPIVLTGAATGSNIARIFDLNQKEKILMLACGASAGIAAIFNCPIAGVIFSFEVLLGEVRIPSFVPLLIASATATVVSKILYEGQLFVLVIQGWDIYAIPYYVLLGVFCGLISAYMINVNTHMENIFRKTESRYKKAVAAGLTLGILIFIFPPLFGEGYTSVKNLLAGNSQALLNNSLFYGLKNEWLFLFYTGLIIFLKIIASALTIGGGGNGGIFAPSLFSGGMAGFFIAHLVNQFGIIELNEINFTAVGMAGILSGVVHCPLTSIFLIAEITGGYALFVPLMIVSASSFFIAKYFEPYSVYTKELVSKGKMNLYDRDFSILDQIKLSQLLEKDFSKIKPSCSLRELIKVLSHSKRNLFPVVNEHNKLEGIILLDTIREIMFSMELYDTTFVKDLMIPPPVILDINTPMHEVMRKFEYFEVWNLPVTQHDQYVGFVSKSRIFNIYRNHLMDQSREIF